MPLKPAERQEFLAQPHIGALSVHVGPGRGPLTVPIWYQYEPGGDLWIVTGADSQKIRALRSAGRFTMLVQRLEPTVRYVSAEGPILRIGEMSEAEHREMAARYLPAEQVDGYLKVAEAFGAMVTVRMRPEHWLSADLGGGDQY
ncbi:pyridoxamine 5'-phosphate oxidase family protein [Nocardia sp. NPDC051832]|uniref:pyridoxamine 5'-phosphate oxidase family protein n=1 Tax=Nocardia sp. NPDC051832 TaxID=3155673 RepID=UPI003429B0E0